RTHIANPIHSSGTRKCASQPSLPSSPSRQELSLNEEAGTAMSRQAIVINQTALENIDATRITLADAKAMAVSRF
ncbi:hypothetical protein AC578_9402, partial [Pseudocercospora eumusae]